MTPQERKAFEAMREALRSALPHLEQMTWNKSGKAADKKVRAALALAEKVGK